MFYVVSLFVFALLVFIRGLFFIFRIILSPLPAEGFPSFLFLPMSGFLSSIYWFLTIVSRMETIVWCKVSLGYHQVRQIGLINFPQDIPLITVSSSFQPFMANTSISSISEPRPDIMCCSDRGYFAGALTNFQLSGKQGLHIHRFDLSVIRFEPGFQHKQ